MCNITKYMLRNLAGGGKLLLMGFLFLIASTAFAQEEKVLNGRIVDDKGNPVVGAIVNVTESSRIALSDENGNFSLKKVLVNADITAACIGYKNTTLKAEFTDDFKIVLIPDLDIYAHTTPVPFGCKEL